MAEHAVATALGGEPNIANDIPSHSRNGRPSESGELELDLAGASAHWADDDLDVVAQLGHQFEELGFADAAELAAGDA
jgi:hypothetical protein